MSVLEDRLSQAENEIRKPEFRQNRGMGNEVGYHIFSYAPDQELMVRAWTTYIEKKYADGSEGFIVQVFDLYDMMIDIPRQKGFLDKCFDFEKQKGFDRIIKAVGNTLRITGEDNLLIKMIQNSVTDHSIIFLTGIGKCYPVLRSHTVLNTMHQAIDKVPVVMLYPGKYSGQDLLLFGEIKDENYSRAFKLVD